MIQMASETILKYAAALFSEVSGLTVSILHEVSSEIAKDFLQLCAKNIC